MVHKIRTALHNLHILCNYEVDIFAFLVKIVLNYSWVHVVAFMIDNGKVKGKVVTLVLVMGQEMNPLWRLG